jgi:hypothetical protein
MHTVHEELGGKVPVWAISHAGCESVPQEQKDHMKLPDLKGANRYLAHIESKGPVKLADICTDVHWWSGGGPLADHHDQKEISLGPLVVRRISARMSASVTEP